VKDSKHPSASLWVTVLLVAAHVLYSLSFGPACWITSRTKDFTLPDLYIPVGWVMSRCPRPAKTAIEAYGRLGMARGAEVRIPIGRKSPMGFKYFTDIVNY